MYSDYVDGLEVWGRTGNESDWTVLWSAYGADLAVDGCYTWFWYDTGGTIQWANHVLDLPSAWTDGSESCLELAFANVGDYGNHIWVDNVNLDAISASAEVSDQAQIQLFPNPNQGACVVVVPDVLLGASYLVHDAQGRVVREGRFAHARMAWEADLTVGVYTLSTPGVAPVRWVVN